MPSQNKKGDAWDKSGGICWYCGLELHPFRTFQVDHLHPVSKGGTNDSSNLAPTCGPCNMSKGDRTLEEFRIIMKGKQGQIFSVNQIKYLEKHGIELPDSEPFSFWFERKGL